MKKQLVSVLLALAFGLPINKPAIAGFDQGAEAYAAGNYAKALEEFQPLAKNGDPASQFALGVMYHNGNGVVQDYRETVSWYRKAAKQGYVFAQHFLGGMYKNGEGVAQDYKEAASWYRKAAEQGYALSQTNLGVLYVSGKGVVEDYKEAVRWYRKAAEQGDALSQNSLGVMYKVGLGVVQDSVVAYAFFNIASAINNDALNDRDSLAANMTSAQIDSAQALTRRMQAVGIARALDTQQVQAPKAKPDVKSKSNPKAISPSPQANGRYPAVPPKRPGVVSCNTNCINGDCWRTYDDGGARHFRAEQKFNSISNEWEWDAGPC
jgi:TPR repeat protein